MEAARWLSCLGIIYLPQDDARALSADEPALQVFHPISDGARALDLRTSGHSEVMLLTHRCCAVSYWVKLRDIWRGQ